MSSSDEIIKKIQKDHGGSVARMGSDSYADTIRIPTGIFPVDLMCGGGIPMGRVSIIFGAESCLDGDTFIQYAVNTAEGRRQNCKGGTLRRLYQRFNNLPRSGSGNYQRKVSTGAVFTAPCMNENGRIFHNRIVGVVDAGVKECLEVITESGLRIVATADHKFHVGHGFSRLGDLQVGDTVMIHNHTPFTKEPSVVEGYRKVMFVKHHPSAPIHRAGEYEYRRLVISRATVEAARNGLTLEEYRDRLNAGDMEGMVFLSSEEHVHHLDEDFTNNALENLAVVTASEHGRLHAVERHDNLRYMVVEDIIVSMVSVGMRHTYDIQMESPYNNFVADGFVVHNSNKTNLCLKVIGQGQRMFPEKRAVFVDAENSFDPVWATTLGVDVDRLIVVSPEYAEQAVDMIEAFLYASDVFTVVLDSIAALSTQNEIESTAEKAAVGGASLVVGKLFKKATVSFNRMRNKGEMPPAFIGINQIRNKIGVLYGDPTTMPGGNAVKFSSSFTMRMYGKNVLDKKVHPVLPAFKETTVTMSKWKVPINATSAVFNMQMIEANGRKPGYVEDWPTLKAYLTELDYLDKAPKGGWLLFGDTFKTLDEIKAHLYGDPAYLQEVRDTIVKEVTSKGSMGASQGEGEMEEVQL